MSSTLTSRNVTVSGHRTSMRLEPDMWDALEEICRREALTIHEVCTLIDGRRHRSSLTAAMRVFILHYFRTAATDDGHARAGHGRLAYSLALKAGMNHVAVHAMGR
jgi:predicted DNA-binding ribbon-helix-helix protein